MNTVLAILIAYILGGMTASYYIGQKKFKDAYNKGFDAGHQRTIRILGKSPYIGGNNE